MNASDKQIKMNDEKFVSKDAGLDKEALKSFENSKNHLQFWLSNMGEMTLS